jgi:ribonucleoside-triphosphate reductase
LSNYQEQYGDLYNLEATPAESTTYRFAKHDTEEFPGIITAAEAGGAPYYTNSSHLPVGYTEDIFAALDLQDELHTVYTSGTVFHAFLGEKISSWKSAALLVWKIAKNYKLPYYTLSPTYSICKNHGYLSGEQYSCPHCHEETEVYSRITGYYRPVKNWNDGKSQEFKERKVYNINAPTNAGAKEVKKGDEEAKVDFEKAIQVEQLSEVGTANVEVPNEDIKPLLFTTSTCPNCPTAKRILDEAGIEYLVVDANEEKELAREYRIMSAPTLVMLYDETAVRVTGVADIEAFVEEVSVSK